MFGVYFHWPYCLSKCIYCDFGSKVIKNQDISLLQNDYLNCCLKQLEYFVKNYKTKKVSSIYFGGGTPSLLNTNIIDILIKETKYKLGTTNDCEITIEANPTSSEKNKFETLYKIGVNRISIGIQSFNDKELLFLGRKHTSKDAINTLKIAKQIFPKWSFDLIYALPRQTETQWLDNLKQALKLEPSHLSLYTLIVEKDTLLWQMCKNGIVKPKNEDEIADFYDLTNDFLETNSQLKQYEISNYAIPGNESRHNVNYWQYGEYVGIGAGAHGRLFCKNTNDKYEIQNIFDIDKWKENITQNGNGLMEEKQLSKIEQVEELLLMGLRQNKGINLKIANNLINDDVLKYLNINKLTALKKDNFLFFNQNTLKLSQKGLKILDKILIDILK